MSNNSEQDVAFIQALADILRASDLSEIEVEREFGQGDELKVRLSRAVAQPIVAAPAPVAAVSVAAPIAEAAPTPQPTPDPAAAAESGPDLTGAITSPMVGTVYLAPEPGAANFITEGDEVQEGQVILIIEAMKTMNQIPAPRSGRVRAIMVENAEPVEFGEPLVIIE